MERNDDENTTSGDQTKALNAVPPRVPTAGRSAVPFALAAMLMVAGGCGGDGPHVMDADIQDAHADDEGTPEPEVCDGDDDDGDARIDEGFLIGTVCDGRGECGIGTIECATATTARCSTDFGGSASMATVESCDGNDNDCDGEVDEAFDVGDACVGDCGVGVVECAGAAASRCSTDLDGSDADPTDELCDDADNDCDGEVDEDLSLGMACPALGQCSAGVLVCDAAGGAVCSTRPGGTASEATDESCDGSDNDCDGDTDEDFGVGVGCDGVGACGLGTVQCRDATTAVCSTEPGGSQSQALPNDALCNRVDDDCDGRVDEDRGVGNPCGMCGGTVECASINTTRCSTDAGGSMPGCCGDGAVTAGERCDPNLAPGDPDRCPANPATDCDQTSGTMCIEGTLCQRRCVPENALDPTQLCP